MRRLPVAFLLAAACTAPVFGAGDVNLVFGRRHLTNDRIWGGGSNVDVSDQTSVGFQVSAGAASWPLRIEGGAQGSEKIQSFGGREVKSWIREASFGAGWTGSFAVGRLHPFAGGGLVYLRATLDDVSGDRFVENSSGVYFHAGVFYTLGKGLDLGIDLRTVQDTEMKVRGATVDADYTQYGVTVGWGWPPAK